MSWSYKCFRYQVIGDNNVAVPTHFFKIIVGEFETTRELEMEAYVLPNEAIPDHVPIHSFQVQQMSFPYYHDHKAFISFLTSK